MLQEKTENDVIGRNHWTKKGDVSLFLWQKVVSESVNIKNTVLFVHGSSMASQPTFDLQVEGRPFSSVMNYFALKGYDTWCVDMEGYGRSDKTRKINCDIATGVDDLATACAYIQNIRNCGPICIYGISSGALRAALFAQQFPEYVSRLALDAFVWKGSESPTLKKRKRKIKEFLKNNRRPIDQEFIQSIFSRDHSDCADPKVIDAFASAICSLDDSVPTGTYVDMCLNLPLVDPKKVTAPIIIMRGQFDGIASMKDLLNFFSALPNSEKQFTIMPGISHASFQQKNYLMVYDILENFFSRPSPVFLDS